MPTGIWTSFLLVLAGMATAAWLVARVYEGGVRPVRGLEAFFGRQSKTDRVLLGAFFLVLWIVAGAKPDGGAGRPALPDANSVGRDVPVAPQTTAWTEERRFTDYAAGGRRIEYMVTESHDCGTVTNSVMTYDLLGRLVTSAVPGANGSMIVTSNAYDGVTARGLSSTRYAPGLALRTTHVLHNAAGEQVGTVLDGVTNRTDVTYAADASGVVWKVETSVVASPDTNALSIVRTRLTGLSDVCRRHVVAVAGAASVPSTGDGGDGAAGVRTETLVSFDPSTGVETETVTSSAGPTTVRRSRRRTRSAMPSSGSSIHLAT